MDSEEFFDYKISTQTDEILADLLSKTGQSFTSPRKLMQDADSQMIFLLASISRTLTGINNTLNEINDKIGR